MDCELTENGFCTTSLDMEAYDIEIKSTGTAVFMFGAISSGARV
jgi:hypothetical protein